MTLDNNELFLTLTLTLAPLADPGHRRTKVGSFSWVLGHDCRCGANLAPAFVLDMTGLIFRTGGRHLDQAQQPR